MDGAGIGRTDPAMRFTVLLAMVTGAMVTGAMVTGVGGGARTCTAPESRRETVDGLLRTMAYSAASGRTQPNPSILIALRLARDHHLQTEGRLRERLREEAIGKLHRGQEFSSGLLALYTLAFTAACHDPQHLDVRGTTVNLLQLLQEKLHQEIQNIELNSVPLTNFYQIGLDVVSLCVHNHPVTPRAVTTLIDAVEGDRFTHSGVYSVDTGAVATLALWCVGDRNPSLHTPALERALQTLVDQLLAVVTPDGLIGNVYSTGLAVQALTVTQDGVRHGRWDCARTLERLLASAEEGALSNPQAASQVTPSLEGRTYLDVGDLDCRRDLSNLTLPELTSPPPPLTDAPTIRVWYNVTDGVGGSFTDVAQVTIPRGSSLLNVMQAARELAPLRFSFQYRTSLWGPFLTSVRGLEASAGNRTYWRLLSGSKPLEQGIGDYIPHDGETLVVILSHY